MVRRFVFLLCSAILALSIAANAKKDSAEAKVQQLNDLSAKRPLIRMNGNKFRDLVRNSPRNYSVVVMFTALSSQRGCQICKQAHDEYQLVANSFRYSGASKEQHESLYFAMVDFDEGPDVFQTMNLNSAPVFMHFPAKGKPKKMDTMDIQRLGFGSEAIAKWIQERTDVAIRVFRPPNYTGSVALLMLFVLVAGLLYLRRNNLEFLGNKRMWGSLACLFVFAMCSGQMWNHIRGPPLIQKTQNGQVAYIHGSSQGQFVIETYLVMGLYLAMGVGMVVMTDAADNVNNSKASNDSGKRKLFACVGCALLAFFFSLILSIFRSKAGGYPYSFLLK